MDLSTRPDSEAALPSTAPSLLYHQACADSNSKALKKTERQSLLVEDEPLVRLRCLLNRYLAFPGPPRTPLLSH